ncbi:unnamed protein product [Heligmosomoides polygyrus]|uniref:Reverse transcriptase domain-containing protein n=1 Tax=Heligmosomoides polygyrus TaxID=6339 RepID=A0A183GJX7_HELPZ|nr:unnamed protein product [Heligmosomoides polygyrus]
MKIFERIVDGRIRDIVLLSSSQCGFVIGSIGVHQGSALSPLLFSGPRHEAGQTLKKKKKKMMMMMMMMMIAALLRFKTKFNL